MDDGDSLLVSYLKKKKNWPARECKLKYLFFVGNRVHKISRCLTVN